MFKIKMYIYVIYIIIILRFYKSYFKKIIFWKKDNVYLKKRKKGWKILKINYVI